MACEVIMVNLLQKALLSFHNGLIDILLKPDQLGMLTYLSRVSISRIVIKMNLFGTNVIFLFQCR